MTIRFPLARTALLCAPLCMGPVLGQSNPEVAQAVQTDKAQDKSPAAQVEAIIAEYNSKIDSFYAAYQAAEDDEARQVLYQSEYPKAAPYAVRLNAVVARTPADPAALSAILWMLQNVDEQAGRPAMLDVLLKHHKASKKLKSVCAVLGRDPSIAAEAFLTQLIAGSESHGTVGRATFALAGVVGTRISFKSRLTDSYESNRADILNRFGAELLQICDTTPLETLQAERKRLLIIVRDKYGDITRWNSTLGKAAKGALFEIDRLQIGMVAPDIEGGDLDGVDFKLSEYRGKVVFLDFWGDW